MELSEHFHLMNYLYQSATNLSKQQEKRIC